MITATGVTRNHPELKPYIYRGTKHDAPGVDLHAANARILAERGDRHGITQEFEWGTQPRISTWRPRPGTRPKTAQPKDTP